MAEKYKKQKKTNKISIKARINISKHSIEFIKSISAHTLIFIFANLDTPSSNSRHSNTYTQRGKYNISAYVYICVYVLEWQCLWVTHIPLGQPVHHMVMYMYKYLCISVCVCVVMSSGNLPICNFSTFECVSSQCGRLLSYSQIYCIFYHHYHTISPQAFRSENSIYPFLSHFLATRHAPHTHTHMCSCGNRRGDQ